jgi:hypothetical protein
MKATSAHAAQCRAGDAVAGHRDQPPLGLQALDHSSLILGERLGHHLVDAELATDRFSRGDLEEQGVSTTFSARMTNPAIWFIVPAWTFAIERPWRASRQRAQPPSPCVTENLRRRTRINAPTIGSLA